MFHTINIKINRYKIIRIKCNTGPSRHMNILWASNILTTRLLIKDFSSQNSRFISRDLITSWFLIIRINKCIRIMRWGPICSRTTMEIQVDFRMCSKTTYKHSYISLKPFQMCPRAINKYPRLFRMLRRIINMWHNFPTTVLR